jgi:hypothetical protein
MTKHVLVQLRNLGDALGELRVRVRAAIAGEVGRAVAEATREVVGRALLGKLGDREVPTRARYDRYQGYARDPWDDPESGPQWAESEHVEEPVGVAEPADPPPMAAAVAMAWTAGKWWLARAGSPLGATALGVAAAGTVLAGGPAARAVLAVLWATHKLLAATDALGDGAKALDRV